MGELHRPGLCSVINDLGELAVFSGDSLALSSLYISDHIFRARPKDQPWRACIKISSFAYSKSPGPTEKATTAACRLTAPKIIFNRAGLWPNKSVVRSPVAIQAFYDQDMIASVRPCVRFDARVVAHAAPLVSNPANFASFSA
jgi:hypothetical protein